ncbi:hypothetical protein BJ741DRAFT_116177 [Chytriomyces cf. hyalinus JEL632]|nr:hypothetical protein BJ741DRAFT_116177 [Chytriomyces cf. hyalinus JEL632]
MHCRKGEHSLHPRIALSSAMREISIEMKRAMECDSDDESFHSASSSWCSESEDTIQKDGLEFSDNFHTEIDPSTLITASHQLRQDHPQNQDMCHVDINPKGTALDNENCAPQSRLPPSQCSSNTRSHILTNQKRHLSIDAPEFVPRFCMPEEQRVHQEQTTSTQRSEGNAAFLTVTPLHAPARPHLPRLQPPLINSEVHRSLRITSTEPASRTISMTPMNREFFGPASDYGEFLAGPSQRQHSERGGLK